MAADSRTRAIGTAMGAASLLLAVVTAILWFRLANRVAIPENRTLFVLLFLAAAGLGVGAFVARTRWYGGLAALLGIVVGVFLPFTVAISRQEIAPDGIRVGDTIPHFMALDDKGQPFDSSSLAGEIVLMKFFRGHW